MRVLFDTKEYWSTLKAAGIPEGHATAIVDGLDRAMHQGVATHEDIVALNSDVVALNSKVERVENRLLIKLGSVMFVMMTISTAVLALVITRH